MAYTARLSKEGMRWTLASEEAGSAGDVRSGPVQRAKREIVRALTALSGRAIDSDTLRKQVVERSYSITDHAFERARAE